MAEVRAGGEALGHALPPLLAAAERLAFALMPGAHGRRRAGPGADFWQYRPAMPGDAARSIDWRRSARSDAPFVREREWQAAQGVTFWVDRSLSMGFASRDDLPTKAARAGLLALALAIALNRAGERVGLEGLGPPRSGRARIEAMVAALGARADRAEWGAPSLADASAHGRAVVISDFLGDLAPLESALATAADRGVKGCLLQVLDPVEEAFPFDGRVIFTSPGAGSSHETQEAGGLRDRYLARLAERKAELARLARGLGWQVTCHHTDAPALTAALWLHEALAAEVAAR